MSLPSYSELPGDHTPSPLPLNEDTTEDALRNLVARFEWVGVAAQALAIVTDLIADGYEPGAQRGLGALAGLHAALSWWFWRKQRGPFGSGGQWGAIWIGFGLLLPIITSYMLASAYGNRPPFAQMCFYPLPPLVFLALYPWGSRTGSRSRRAPVEIVVLGTVVAEPFVLMSLIQGPLNAPNHIVGTLTGAVSIFSFLVGKAARALCQVALTSPFETLGRIYEWLEEFFHSRVKSTQMTVTELVRQRRYDEISAELDKLKHWYARERRKLQLSMAEVNVLRLIRDTAREFSAVLVIERDTMLGLTNVSQPVGEIIERTLRNLLTNVVEHGKGPVHVQYAVDNAVAFLVVKDKGPGLSPAVLKDRSTALHQIARHAKELGGGLEVVPDYTEGACIRLFIPTL